MVLYKCASQQKTEPLNSASQMQQASPGKQVVMPFTDSNLTLGQWRSEILFWDRFHSLTVSETGRTCQFLCQPWPEHLGKCKDPAEVKLRDFLLHQLGTCVSASIIHELIAVHQHAQVQGRDAAGRRGGSYSPRRLNSAIS